MDIHISFMIFPYRPVHNSSTPNFSNKRATVNNDLPILYIYIYPRVVDSLYYPQQRVERSRRRAQKKYRTVESPPLFPCPSSPFSIGRYILARRIPLLSSSTHKIRVHTQTPNTHMHARAEERQEIGNGDARRKPALELQESLSLFLLRTYTYIRERVHRESLYTHTYTSVFFTRVRVYGARAGSSSSVRDGRVRARSGWSRIERERCGWRM